MVAKSWSMGGFLGRSQSELNGSEVGTYRGRKAVLKPGQAEDETETDKEKPVARDSIRAALTVST